MFPTMELPCYRKNSQPSPKLLQQQYSNCNANKNSQLQVNNTPVDSNAIFASYLCSSTWRMHSETHYPLSFSYVVSSCAIQHSFRELHSPFRVEINSTLLSKLACEKVTNRQFKNNTRACYLEHLSFQLGILHPFLFRGFIRKKIVALLPS